MRQRPGPGREPSIRIRPGRAEDVDALLSIEQRSFGSDQLDRRAFRHAIRSQSMSLIVAEGGGDLLGYAIIELRRGSTLARLTSVAVDGSSAGRGLGRRLLDAIEAEAEARGCDRVRLEVRADNDRAIRLYERAGYTRREEMPDYYEDGAAACRFEKSL